MTLPAGIDTLKASIARRGGMARSNRFAIYMTHPNKKQGLLNTDLESLAGNAARSLISGGSLSVSSFIDDPRDMYLFCESVQMPGRQVTTTEHFTGMKAIKKPYAFLNEDVAMTFNLTNDFYIYKYLKSWMDLVIPQDSETDFFLNFKENYTTDIIIQQMGNTDYIPVYSVVLRNAYPISLNSIELSNASENAVTQCSVTFAYDNWYEEGLLDGFARRVGQAGSLITNSISAVQNIGKLF